MKKILVVDDEESFLMLVKLNLEKTGKYEVSTVSSAKDIVSKVNMFKPDIILLDIIMPGIRGIDACEMLNKDPVGARVPIIILSALDTDYDRLKAYKVGVVDYLAKPVDTAELIRRIEKALEFR
ncbi:MAG: response regulator [Candidatus Omnitrophota bacterium]